MASIVASGMYFGEIVGISISGLLVDSSLPIGDGVDVGGWPAVFYLFGIVGLLWFPIWAWRVYETPELHPKISEEELAIFRKSKEKMKMKRRNNNNNNSIASTERKKKQRRRFLSPGSSKGYDVLENNSSLHDQSMKEEPISPPSQEIEFLSTSYNPLPPHKLHHEGMIIHRRSHSHEPSTPSMTSTSTIKEYEMISLSSGIDNDEELQQQLSSTGDDPDNDEEVEIKLNNDEDDLVNDEAIANHPPWRQFFTHPICLAYYCNSATFVSSFLSFI